MPKTQGTLWSVVILVLLLAGPATFPSRGVFHSPDVHAASAPAATVTLPEGNDFATRVLRDPWDMGEFSDVSQWFNHIPGAHLENFQIQDGVFSATTSGGYFFTLFAGYPPAVKSGKIGARFPIPSSQYACFAMAMYVETGGLDYYHVSWQADQNLVDSGFIYNTPVASGIWKLYQVDLRTWGYISGERWTDRAFWQGLRVQPATNPNTQFAVDWVRLTDCSPVIHNLQNLPAGTYDLWLGTGTPERQILAVENFEPEGNGTYAWDVQGIAPGSYRYYITPVGGGAAVQQGDMVINQTPIVHFVRPSPLTGVDYATTSGNAWDMSASDDTTQIKCTIPTYEDGLLKLDTKPPSQVPGCVRSGANEVDPNVLLNTPQAVDIRQYRYLSFHHKLDGAWSLPEQGMIVRWIWVTSNPGTDCHYVSRSVSLDVFWDTYVVDLHEGWNGIPEESEPSWCGLTAWRDQSYPVIRFRLDPNENITNNVLHQEFDWIRLTRVESAARGTPFPIQIKTNESPDSLSLTFYYTIDLNNPTQHPAQAYTPPAAALPQGSVQIYLPVAPRAGDPFLQQLNPDFTYLWDTTGVTPGEYYVCTVAADGHNRAIYCSDAPLIISDT